MFSITCLENHIVGREDSFSKTTLASDTFSALFDFTKKNLQIGSFKVNNLMI